MRNGISVGTLDGLLAIDYPAVEIIVVDDSTDMTPAIVRRYEARGVRLIHPPKREAAVVRVISESRASGDVVVILNADVHPRPDFLRRLVPYYEQGYDYVLVNSRVSNTHALYARYVDSMGAAVQGGDPSWMEWTEGFSCRRNMAIRAGLFPTGFPVPICAGEDGFFGANLKKLGARKKIDFSITVDHVAPGAFAEYWHIRKGRGKGSPQIRRFLQRWSMGRIVLRALLRVARTALYIVLVIPAVSVVWRASRQSEKGSRDLLPFLWAWSIEQIAFHVGEWESIVEINRAERATYVQGPCA